MTQQDKQTPAWLDRTEYPFESHFFDVKSAKMHYVDEGKGDPILFVHGTPSWSFDFRNVIKKLSKHHRCLAIDHIGFGLSDKPIDHDYSTQTHSDNLEAFINHLDLYKVTLVLHDFGGPIGWNAALHNSERISNIVLMNTWLENSESQPDFKKFSRILRSPLLPFLYRRFNFSARVLLPRSFGDKKLSKVIHRQYLKPFARRSKREGTVAFANSLLNDQKWFGELWEQRDRLKSKSILLIWGMRDTMVTSHYLDTITTGRPDANVLRLETVGHFPQEEAPDLVADRIFDFIADKVLKEK